MLAGQELNELAERRRLLVAEAELHRSLIAWERENLRSGLDALREARGGFKLGGRWLAGAGALAGLLTVRHWRKLWRWFPFGFVALRWVRKLQRQ